MTTFIEEQTAAGASGLRVQKEPGDPAWCWQTISYLQTIWKNLELDYSRYMQAWSEAEEHKVWEKVPYDSPFGTKEEMLKQLELGDDKQVQRRMQAQPIARKVRLRYSHGRDHRSGEFQASHGKLERGRNNREYLLARILHTRPDVFDRWEQGEYRSAAAAAKEAGIPWVARSKTITLSNNVERVADRLKSHYSPEQLRLIMKRLISGE